MKILYHIKCKDTKIREVYIGQTKNLDDRIKRHKESAIRFPNRKVYKFIMQNGGWNNWEFEEVKTLNDESVNVFEEERNILEENEKNLNTYKPYLTPEEKVDYLKKWKKRNKLHIKKYREEYNKKEYTCPCGSHLKWCNKSKHVKTLKHQAYLISLL